GAVRGLSARRFTDAGADSVCASGVRRWPASGRRRCGTPGRGRRPRRRRAPSRGGAGRPPRWYFGQGCRSWVLLFVLCDVLLQDGLWIVAGVLPDGLLCALAALDAGGEGPDVREAGLEGGARTVGHVAVAVGGDGVQR